MTEVALGPSILTANLLALGDAIREAEDAGVDFIHLDIMDGRFVPNITFGPVVVESVRAATTLPLDVHLMIEEPDRHIEAFVSAGADAVIVHVEASRHLHAALQRIRELGASPGVALNPLTPLSVIEDALPFLEQVLIMSVNPGFGGQAFIPTALRRIARLRVMIEESNPGCRIEVDGGIKASNIGKVVAAGAQMIVAGSAIFSTETPVAEAVRRLRAGVEVFEAAKQSTGDRGR
jgi:ribulose-phosphate 3-epimerase